jgi:hypothetical protein
MPACILLLVLEVLILSLRIRGGNEVWEGLQGVVAVAAAEGVDLMNFDNCSQHAASILVKHMTGQAAPLAACISRLGVVSDTMRTRASAPTRCLDATFLSLSEASL